MTLQEYLEKQMQDPEFGKAYEDIQPEIDAIRTSIDGANAGFNQETEETMKEVDIPVSSLTDALSGVLKADIDLEQEKEERLREKYMLPD